VIDAWLDLKGRDAWATIVEDRLRTVLHFVGFVVPPDSGALRLLQESRDWLHLRVRMSASGASPVPQFGSQAREQYNVVCVRERPGVDVLTPVLRDLPAEGHPILVVYLGRLPMSQRRALSGLTRPRLQPLIALDELMLLFLTREAGRRLAVFLRCAVPYSSVNPFTPFQAGDVPPEMFFGRQAMAHEVARPEGTCVVYGGRQLGKSALLRHVERRLDRPVSGMYARVVDIKLIGDPLSDPRPDALWLRLRDTLKEMGLLAPNVTSDRPDRIQQHVRELVRQRSDVRQLTVLFDEADSFLDADAREGFRVVTELRDLMNVSRRRFKVVFAGLQNVQRFQGIPNQPLAHFGQALLVGPLEPADAEALVRQTFRALGFRFIDRTVILRILSYTNYHPGLIQLFCQELLWNRRAAVGVAAPPHDIGADDVERVYRQPSVHDAIRERFDWTLALDPRYQCIACAIIEDQRSDRDGYARPYAPAEVQELARFWWKAGFQGVAFDRFRGLLDEMCGLGVLVRQADGRYRLRSPNLVPLMGRDRDIEARLLELAQREASPVFEADSHHAALEDARCYSPLTYAQERTALAPRYGVVLVVGSWSLGLEAVPQGLRRALRIGDQGEGERLVEIPEELVQGPALRDWLRRHQAPVVVQVLRGPGLAAAERVEAALVWCRSRSRERRIGWSRVVFLMDPRALWEWLGLASSRVKDLESRVDAAITLNHWNAAGIRRRLEQHEKISSDEKVNAALDATGGWPVLLDALLDRSHRRDDVQPAAEALNGALATAGNPLMQQFVGGLGLDVWPGIRPVVQFVRTLGEVGPDDLLPELIESPERLDVGMCRRVMEFLSRLGIVSTREGRWRLDPVVARVLAADSS
jgi:hypothetical protein